MANFLFITKPFVIEPLGIMYLSGYLKAAGHMAHWVTTGDGLVEKVKEFAPDFIGYSVITGDHNFFDEVNSKLKTEADFFSIAGGPHPTFFPEYVANSSFDAICRGEGELVLADLVANYTGGNYQFPNFWFNTDEGVCENPQSGLVQNLDDIPFPDRELIYGADENQRNNPIKHFIASRGCPYACAYCFNHGYSDLYKGKGKHVRFRSVDNVLEEVEGVMAKYPTKFVYFQDDVFILNKGWLEEFSRKYSERIGFPFHCHVRANLVDEDVIRLLKQANCRNVQMAIESGNERIRNEVLRRGMSEKQIYNACELLHKYDIKFMLQNILGLPTGNLENDLETLEMNVKCRPTYGWASIFQPYPGTDLAKLCLEKKLVSEEQLNDIQGSFFHRSILSIKDKKKVEYLQKLFAVAVEYPVIYNSGLLSILLEMPDQQIIRDVLEKIYKSFRGACDRKLFGMNI